MGDTWVTTRLTLKCGCIEERRVLTKHRRMFLHPATTVECETHGTTRVVEVVDSEPSEVLEVDTA